MPLVRFGVKNEYSLGVEELYKDGVLSEDPKAVLDGVSVAGLVGLLRQLGDLAQFAAEVFHGLQEQVASTSSRSRKLVNRVQQIEASLPSLEKAILSQTDHLRFAYAPGSEWHACIREERNHFICDDLPHFIMDSYEECREPPRLQLLDRFDSGGPGSCLKRYSDPTFFRRASFRSEVSNSEKSRGERKARKIKKRRSWQRSGQFSKSAQQVLLNGSDRMQFSSTGQGQSSLSLTGSTFDITFKSDLGDRSDSHGSKDGVDFIDSVSRPSISMQPDEIKMSSSVKEEVNANGPKYLDEQTAIASDDKPCSPAMESNNPPSSSTWDEELEMIEPPDVNYENEVVRQLPVNDENVNQVYDFSEQRSTPESEADRWYLRTNGDGNIIEATRLNCGINEVQGNRKTMTNFDLQGHHLEPAHPKSCTQVLDQCEGLKPFEPNSSGNLISDSGCRRLETGDAEYYLESNFDVAEKELEAVKSEHLSVVNGLLKEGNQVESVEWNQPQSEAVNTEHVSQVDASFQGENNVNVIEWSQQNLEAFNPEHVIQDDAFSEGGSNVKVIEWNHLELETTSAEQVNQEDSFSEGVNCMKLIDWDQQKLEEQIAEDVGQFDTSTEAGNNVQVIEWNEHEDIDSGTENFVDALNTIESESESDFETEMKKEVQGRAYRDEMGEDAMNGQTEEIISHLVSECQHPSTSENCQEGGLEDLDRSTASVSSADMWSPDRTQSFQDKSESVAGQKLDISTCLSDEQDVQNSQSTLISNISHDLDICANEPEMRLDTAVCEITKSGSEAPGDEGIISAPHLSEEISAGSSTTYPPAFWTNGTLFGLQPSKPTVFSKPDLVDSAPTSNIKNVGQCSLDAMRKIDVPAGLLASSINESEHGNKLDRYGQDVGSSKPFSDQRLQKTCDTSVRHEKRNSSDHPVIRDLINGDAMPHDSNNPVDTNVKILSSEAAVASEDRSSLLTMLSRGLLKNGLRRSGSLGFDEKHSSSNSSIKNDFDNRCQNSVSHSVTETNLKEKLNSPVNSPPLSPPLEHMKISFQPVDGFDTSRLKLKYPEGVDHYESTLDAFPSFQLVPESTKLQRNVGSDSDDDTFCRSYACMSDESHSHLSDSNSEQWESGDSTESNDHTLYNGLQRISSAESASVSPQHEEADHENKRVGSRSFSDAHSLSDPSFGLQIMDASNAFAYQEMRLCMNPGVDSSHLQEATHEPPPLPPLQWRASRTMFNEIQDNQDQRSDSPSQSFVPKLLNTAIAHPAKVDSSKLLSTAQESATIAKPIKVEDQKFGQEQTYDAEKDQTMDDKGDFLQQIRTKSFNLKRTEPARSTFAPTPVTSYKITAILQKANAIRKAVGSDDGEDDSWSDT